MPALRKLSRAAKVGGVCAAALALTMSPASATVTPGTAGGTQVYLDSDGAGDNMSLACTAGQVRYVQGSLDLLACNLTDSIRVTGNGGNDAVDLSALGTAGNFPVLNFVNIDVADFSGTDTVKGSFFGDTVEADQFDVVEGLGGNDEITGGDSVSGGDGDDTFDGPSRLVDGGPGDDRMIGVGSGPNIGGPGEDTIELDVSNIGAPIDINFVINDTILHLDVPSVPSATADVPVSQFEVYDFKLPSEGTTTWNSAAYSGSVDLKGLGGVDKIVAGPGEDFIDGGADNDELVGGAGFDYIKGGLGDDVVNSRDGAVDRVICGDGNDTVVADAGDVLTGCETIQLPPAPPPPPAPVVPDTGKVKGPKTVVQGEKAKFTFKSLTAGATFQCKVDKKAWKACKSPHKVATKNLKASNDGTKHVLKVRAVVAGVVDKTPSKKTFKVTKS